MDVFSGIFTLICVIGGAIVVFFIIFFVVAIRSAGRGGAGAPKMATRLKDDGFWVDTVGMNRSKRLRYRTMQNGRWTNAETTIVPGRNGHYVYTGYQPEQVQLIGLNDALATRAAMADSDPSPMTSHSSSSSFPSAY